MVQEVLSPVSAHILVTYSVVKQATTNCDVLCGVTCFRHLNNYRRFETSFFLTFRFTYSKKTPRCLDYAVLQLKDTIVLQNTDNYHHNISEDLKLQQNCFKKVKFLKNRLITSKDKGLPRQAEVVQGVPGRLRPGIFLTFRHYKGGRSSAKRTGRLYPRRNPWYSLSESESTSGHMVLSGAPRKKSTVTPLGIDPGTVRLVAQRRIITTLGKINVVVFYVMGTVWCKSKGSVSVNN